MFLSCCLMSNSCLKFDMRCEPVCFVHVSCEHVCACIGFGLSLLLTGPSHCRHDPPVGDPTTHGGPSADSAKCPYAPLLRDPALNGGKKKTHLRGRRRLSAILRSCRGPEMSVGAVWRRSSGLFVHCWNWFHMSEGPNCVSRFSNQIQ